MGSEERQQFMDSISIQLRDLFENDDGSLPEIELTNLGPATIPRIFEMLWRRSHEATAGGASYCDRGDGRDKPIASAEDAANAAVLVCSQKAESIHVVLGRLECAGSVIPDLGVFVHRCLRPPGGAGPRLPNGLCMGAAAGRRPLRALGRDR